MIIKFITMYVNPIGKRNCHLYNNKENFSILQSVCFLKVKLASAKEYMVR